MVEAIAIKKIIILTLVFLLIPLVFGLETIRPNEDYNIKDIFFNRTGVLTSQVCNITIWYPNGTLAIEDGVMTNSSTGYHNYSVNFEPSGRYDTLVSCWDNEDSKYYTFDYSFEVGLTLEDINETTQTISSNLLNINSSLSTKLNSIQTLIENTNTSTYAKLVSIHNDLLNINTSLQDYLTAMNTSYTSYFNGLMNNQTVWFPSINNSIKSVLDNQTMFNTINDNINLVLDNQSWFVEINDSIATIDFDDTAILNAIEEVNSTTIDLQTFLELTNISYTDYFQGLRSNQTTWFPSINTSLSTLTFNDTEILNAIGEINDSIDGYFLVSMTDQNEILATKQYRAEIMITDFNGNMINATSVKITMLDPLLSTIVSDVNMDYEEDGRYSYNYTTSPSANDGVWTAIVSTTVNGKVVKTIDYWELETNPAQVQVEVIDTTIPSIVGRILIENEGTTSQEYQYRYWITNNISGLYGDSTMVDSGSGAKLIGPGDTYVVDKTLTVSTNGTYWFKVEVDWGTETSGASDQFIAIPSSGSAGSGGETCKYDLDCPDGYKCINNKCTYVIVIKEEAPQVCNFNGVCDGNEQIWNCKDCHGPLAKKIWEDYKIWIILVLIILFILSIQSMFDKK